jgi:phage shock protein PspC (stress-responsive transcriptional regulator)/heme/copper-type cytochrome/quinol oxidase subunit 2
MKQVININYHGRIIPIEITAYDILKSYSERLNRYFENEHGKEEIINDIESRLGELFQERIKNGANCITDDDVNAIIKSMGNPEEFDAEINEESKQKSEAKTEREETKQARRLYRDENHKLVGGVCSGLANYFNIDIALVRIIFVIAVVSFGFGIIPYLILWIAVPSSATKEIGSVRKKLYRDTDEKIVAGVCSGIANYFSIDVWIPRVLFLLPFIGVVFNWNWHNIITFSPGSIIVYIICWLVIPEAKTTSEKLEMKGEKIDLNSIKQTIKEEIKSVHQKTKQAAEEIKENATKKSSSFFGELKSFIKTIISVLIKIISFLIKAFVYFVLAVIAIALILALFSIALASFVVFPFKDFIIESQWQNIFAWGTLIFFIIVPVVGLLTWIIRKIMRTKANRFALRTTFIALWIIGWASFIGLLVTLSNDFKYSSNLDETAIALNNPKPEKLNVFFFSKKNILDDNAITLSDILNTADDTAFVENVKIRIEKSDNDSFNIVMKKFANGKNREAADVKAKEIEYSILQQDSVLLLNKGISFTQKTKFRNQRVIVTIRVPVGKKIRINDYSSEHNIIFGSPWNARGFEYSGRWQDSWDSDKDYIMKEDGLHEVSETSEDKILPPIPPAPPQAPKII